MDSLFESIVRFVSRLAHQNQLPATMLTDKYTAQQLHLSVGRILQGNDIGGKIGGYPA